MSKQDPIRLRASWEGGGDEAGWLRGAGWHSKEDLREPFLKVGTPEP